jgi:hypothetical protein
VQDDQHPHLIEYHHEQFVLHHEQFVLHHEQFVLHRNYEYRLVNYHAFNVELMHHLDHVQQQQQSKQQILHLQQVHHLLIIFLILKNVFTIYKMSECMGKYLSSNVSNKLLSEYFRPHIQIS